MKERQVKLNL
uniref:Uncharacterized protein n=1 Tax=Arundo donax TaxID=35708 RepID=A0A0A8Y416_ARUDO